MVYLDNDPVYSKCKCMNAQKKHLSSAPALQRGTLTPNLIWSNSVYFQDKQDNLATSLILAEDNLVTSLVPTKDNLMTSLVPTKHCRVVGFRMFLCCL